MTESGENMSQLTALVEAICKDFRGHDEGEIRVQPIFSGGTDAAGLVL